MLTLMLFSYLVATPGYHASTILVLLILITQCILIVRFVTKTNAELARFFSAARYADFSQRFEMHKLGSGFDELGEVFSEILQHFQNIRAENEEKLIHLKAIVEHVPVPLMSLHVDGSLALWNNDARRLFGSHQVEHIKDLSQFSKALVEHLQKISAGERRLVTFEVDGMEQQLSIAATQIIASGRQEKLISMQDIQSELDGAQLQAWQDLVKVLTHEIMNSITPVSSLAKTAVDLLQDIKIQASEYPELEEELSDVSSAVTTVAKRSDGLMKFVSSYRQLTRLPPPNKKNIKLVELFSQVKAIATQHWQKKGIVLNTQIKPQSLSIHIDIDMVEQVLINLLKNAEQAVVKVKQPSISMNAFLNKRGHVVIDVSDNGHGIEEEIIPQIFVPFFTTKRDGSGVGLALTRQVMLTHGGKIKFEKSQSGGALFRLTF